MLQLLERDGAATAVSVGWLLLSVGRAGSWADFRKGHSLVHGQPWVPEAFASPPGTVGVQDGSVPVAPGWLNVRSVQSCPPVLIN